MIDVELSPELRDGGAQNHLKVEDSDRRKRLVFSLDSMGKTEITERIEIDLDSVDSDQDLAMIDAPQTDVPADVTDQLCPHLV